MSLRAQDGTLDTAFDPGVGPVSSYSYDPYSQVKSLAVQVDGKLLIAGHFTSVDGVARVGIARLNTDGSLDSGFVPATTANNGDGKLIAVQLDGKILYSNTLNSYDDPSETLIRFNPDGSRDPSFRFGLKGQGGINSLLVLPDGRLIVNLGTYDPNTGAAASGLARINTDGSIDPNFNVSATNGEYAVTLVTALQSDGKILVGGQFETINGAQIRNLARVNADGTLDDSFLTHFAPRTFVANRLLVQPGGKILAVAASYFVDGVERDGTIRFNPDGSFDPTFTTYLPPEVGFASDAILQSDGKFIIVSGQKSVRFNVDGTQDNSFATVTSSDPPTIPGNGSTGGYITTLARGTDGKIYVGGSFAAVNGTPRINVARLNNTAPAVAASPQVTSPASASATAGASFSYQITASNSPVSFAVSGLPDGLTINATTGVISGTASTPGVYSLVVGATNAGGTGTAPLTLTIAANPQVALPAIMSATGAYGQYNVDFEYQITATNSPVSYSAGDLPAGIILDSRTGLLSGSPTVTGTFNITLGATNAGGTGTANLTLIVTLSQPPGPVVTSATTAAGQVGQPFSYQITATNYPTAYLAGNLPPGLSVNASTGLISGTPTAAGTYQSYVYAANSATTGNESSLLITVADAPVSSPVITSSTNASVRAGQFFTYQITALNGPTSYAVTGLPSGLIVDPASGIILGTPAAAGTFSIGLSASNASGTGTATLVLTVTADPDIPPPVITGAASASVQVGQSFTYQITATNAPTSYAASGLPGGLSLDPTTGVISGTLRTVGTFTLNLSAGNAGGTGTATLTLTITSNPAVTAPAITSVLSATAQIGQAFSYQITAANSPTSYAATRLPNGLSVNTATGVISGTPSTAGTFPVGLSATNAGGTGTATLTLTVAPALPLVSLMATTPTVTAGSGDLGVFTLSLSAAQDHDVFVAFTIKGTAVNGTDYVLLKGTKKIKAGKTSKPIKIIPVGAGGGTGVKRTVVLILQPGDGYEVGTKGKVKVKIIGE